MVFFLILKYQKLDSNRGGGRGGGGGGKSSGFSKIPHEDLQSGVPETIECLSDSQFAENRGGIYKISSVSGVRQP
jgi:hypothetical protein